MYIFFFLQQSSTTSFDHQTSGDCFREELHVNEKDKLLLSLNMQLKQLQVGFL